MYFVVWSWMNKTISVGISIKILILKTVTGSRRNVRGRSSCAVDFHPLDCGTPIPLFTNKINCPLPPETVVPILLLVVVVLLLSRFWDILITIFRVTIFSFYCSIEIKLHIFYGVNYLFIFLGRKAMIKGN